MSLNTRIRGLQIKDSDIDTLQLKDDGVTNDKLANIAQGSIKVGGGSNAPTDLDAKTDKQILIGDGTDITSVAVSGDITISNLGVVAIGATKVVDTMVNDDVATGLAGVGLSDASGVMAVDLQEVAEVAIAVADDYVVLLDGGISGDTKKEKFADVVTAIAGTGLTATSGVLSVDTIVDNIVEADFQFEDKSAECDDAEVNFTLSETPVANSLQVFLNGLLQQEGSGKDYYIVGTTVTFAVAPLTGASLLIHYLRND